MRWCSIVIDAQAHQRGDLAGNLLAAAEDHPTASPTGDMRTGALGQTPLYMRDGIAAADRRWMMAEDARIRRSQAEEVEHQQSAASPRLGISAAPSNGGVIDDFICCRWIQADEGADWQILIPDDPERVSVLATLGKLRLAPHEEVDCKLYPGHPDPPISSRPMVPAC